MNYYTSTIPPTLAEKLKEKGMPYIEIDCETYDSGTEYQRDEVWCNNTYAEVFDWLMENGFSCDIISRGAGYDYAIVKECNDCTRGTSRAYNNYEGPNDGGCWDTWHEAAEKAIEKALTLI